jgi:antibiotic biosynthesis monooxygenase (ABM) superfamily enzyme
MYDCANLAQLHKPGHADAYEAMLKPELLPGIGRVAGHKSSYLRRRDLGDEIEFITIMLWDSLEAIRTLAGPRLRDRCNSRGTPTISSVWWDPTFTRQLGPLDSS